MLCLLLIFDDDFLHGCWIVFELYCKDAGVAIAYGLAHLYIFKVTVTLFEFMRLEILHNNIKSEEVF